MRLWVEHPSPRVWALLSKHLRNTYDSVARLISDVLQMKLTVENVQDIADVQLKT